MGWGKREGPESPLPPRKKSEAVREREREREWRERERESETQREREGEGERERELENFGCSRSTVAFPHSLVLQEFQRGFRASDSGLRVRVSKHKSFDPSCPTMA